MFLQSLRFAAIISYRPPALEMQGLPFFSCRQYGTYLRQERSADAQEVKDNIQQVQMREQKHCLAHYVYSSVKVSIMGRCKWP